MTAAVLIALGVIMLWNYLMDFLYTVMGFLGISHTVYILFRSFGTFSLRGLFAVCIICLGIHLIRAKNQELHGENKQPPETPLLPGDQTRDL